jgi:hypothetical protein
VVIEAAFFAYLAAGVACMWWYETISPKPSAAGLVAALLAGPILVLLGVIIGVVEFVREDLLKR